MQIITQCYEEMSNTDDIIIYQAKLNENLSKRTERLNYKFKIICISSKSSLLTMLLLASRVKQFGCNCV